MKKDKVDKLTDKAFLRLIITSVLAIVFCLVCLCSTTWAWFTESQESASNSIKSANCMLEITVSNVNDANETTVIAFEMGETELDLTSGNKYSVVLAIPDDSASGYCIIKIIDGDTNSENDVKLYSQAVSNNGSPYTRELNFSIVAEADAKVKIVPCWGIYSGNADIEEGEIVKINATGFVSETDGEQSDSETESADSEQPEGETESEN